MAGSRQGRPGSCPGRGGGGHPFCVGPEREGQARSEVAEPSSTDLTRALSARTGPDLRNF